MKKPGKGAFPPMLFRETGLEGAWLLEMETREDERGSFARTFCRHEFEARGLNPGVAQASISHNRRRGTLRGLHYQEPPHAEAKLVQCLRGAIFDVIVDLRPGSAGCCRWYAVELNAVNGRLLYVPEGFAHGFQTLKDDTLVYYLISEFFEPHSARGARWNDPAFGIEWPLPDPILSEKDRLWPDFRP